MRRRAWIPTYTGTERRRLLVARWGLPNAAPSAAERAKWGQLACLRTQRVEFVDDDNDGAPVAYWQPEESRP